MGFLRKQQENLALRLLISQYKKQKLPLPEPQVLARQAVEMVSKAHAVARERGRNVVGILKDLVADIRSR